jgi:UDP-N-acetylmuramate dehydrogenase
MTVVPNIQADFPLHDHNTFGIHATAKRYVTITSLEMLQKTLASADVAGLPRLVLGSGSNILLTGDFPGVVLHMCMKGMAIVGEDAHASYVKVAGGENWHQFVQWTLTHGLGGLENLSLIPGSVGAAPIQNIGAYGAELKDCFHCATVFDLESGEVASLDKAACSFGYRDSIFKQALRGRSIILDVTFALSKQWQPNLRYAELSQEIAARGLDRPSAADISDAVIAIRSRKLPDPAVIGNAGSFFKNPVVPAPQRHALLERYPQLVSYVQPDGSYKLAAGWLIEQCGWKGKSLSAAGVYEKQALVLVNRGGASGQDMLKLARKIQEDVQARFGVQIEPEPVIV